MSPPPTDCNVTRPGPRRCFVIITLYNSPRLPNLILYAGDCLKKVLYSSIILILTSAIVSCGGGGSSTPRRNQTFFAQRVFITNFVAGAVTIIDAMHDAFGSHVIGTGAGASLMATT